MHKPTRQQLDDVVRTRRPAVGPVAQRPRRLLEPALLQRAALGPAALGSADLMSLQGTLGNRAVGRLLNIMPAGRPEHEADEVARRVAGAGASLPAPLLSRDEEPAPVALTPQLEAGIGAARGGGRPMPGPLRAGMEQALGADLGGVRLHTDERADRLSRALHARAFTTGPDIFFRNAEFDSASAAGRQVLAHELAHVVQQRGGQAAAGGRPALGSAPAGAVQRLISEADFKKLAGGPSVKSKLDLAGGTYTDILKLLKKHENAKDAKKPKILAGLKKLCAHWVQGHTRAVVGGKQGEIEPKDKDDLRKASFITALLEEVKAALGEPYDAEVMTPSETVADVAAKLNAAMGAVTLDLNSAPASRYVLTLYSAVKNPDLIPFAQKRLALTIKTKTSLFGAKKSSEEIKTTAATQVVEEKIATSGKTMSDAEKQQAVQKVAEGSREVGHSWVRLRKYGAKDELQADHSFGFYPLEGYNRPELAVPGEVVYRDKAPSGNPSQLAKDYAVSRSQYEAALQDALQTMADRPDYKLVDYNCTLFAKQVVEAAGQAFPGKAYMRVPANPLSAVTGIGWGQAYNPNALHERMGVRESVYEPKPESVGWGFGVGYEESSEDVAAGHVRLLEACVGQAAMTLTRPVVAVARTNRAQVTLPVGTVIKVDDVDDDASTACIDVAGKRLHDVSDLAALCAALQLG